MNKAPDDAKGRFKAAMALINPYLKAGKFKPFDGNTALVNGVKAVSARGHTPGHSIYMAESKSERMVFWGDLMHVASVQFENPAVTIRFDSDSKAAAEQRFKAYAEAAREGYVVSSAHLSFPGIGRLRADGTGYAWLPVNYSVVSSVK